MRMGTGKEHCVLCGSPPMIVRGKENPRNQLKYQVRTIFVLQQLLKISTATCCDLLSLGNPSDWFSYCSECFESVIEAELVFSRLQKLTKSWNVLREGIEKKLYKCYTEKDSLASSFQLDDSELVGRIWKESVETLISSENIKSTNFNTNLDKDVKIEVESMENERYFSDNDFTPTNENGLNEENSLSEKRTRSGREIKEKYLSDSDESIRNYELSRESSGPDDSQEKCVRKPNEDAKKIRCNQCSSVFTRLERLHYHQRQNHGTFSCDQCSLHFTNEHKLKNHIYSKHRSVDFGFQCSRCKEKFVTAGLLDIHMKSSHNSITGQSKLQDADFQCKQCLKKCFTFTGLIRHETRIHVSGKEKPFPCDKCPKGFFTYRQFIAHNFKDHNGSSRKDLTKKKTLRHIPKASRIISSQKTESMNLDNVAKIEIENEWHSLDNDSTPTNTNENCVNEEIVISTLDGNGVMTQETPCREDEVSTAKKASGDSNAEKRSEKRSRSGRVIKEKYLSDTDDSNRNEELDGEISGSDGEKDETKINELAKNLRCDDCSRVFTSVERLHEHQQIHGTFSCDQCPFHFSNQYKLKSHIYSEHRRVDFDFQCSLCKEKFVTAGLLDIHMKSIHKDQQGTDEQSELQDTMFQCTQCPKKCFSLVGLIRHETRTHVSGKEKPFPCSKCPSGFFTYKGFLAHSFHEHNILYRKDLKIWKPKKTVRQIPKIVREKPFACTQCEYKFVSETSLEDHIIKQHNKNFSVKCTMCPKEFKYTYRMKNHIRLRHQQQKDFICDVCGKSFYRKLELKYHIMQEHEKSEKLKCKVCGHIALSPHVLKKHIVMVHNKSSCAFKCPVCPYGAISRFMLNAHVITRHTNEKPFSCTLCKKAYPSKSSLVIHMRSHTGERPYSCPVCQRTFYTMAKMKRHQQDLHSTEKPYQCEQCGRSFPSKRYLTGHIYETHRKKQKNPVPEKVLIDKELLKEIIGQNSKELNNKSS